MFTLVRFETAGQEIRKSRFLAVAGPVSSEIGAREFIAAHSNPAAGHNCWAWRVGRNYRFSDDGEPSGTAGKPILQVLDGHALDHVAIVVTRWFGGVLLGTGGLMRAYGGTASMCLRPASKVPVIATVKARITCGFADLAIVKARLSASSGVRIAGETFIATGAELVVTLPQAETGAIVRMVRDVTSGRAAISVPA